MANEWGQQAGSWVKPAHQAGEGLNGISDARAPPYESACDTHTPWALKGPAARTCTAPIRPFSAAMWSGVARRTPSRCWSSASGGAPASAAAASSDCSPGTLPTSAAWWTLPTGNTVSEFDAMRQFNYERPPIARSNTAAGASPGLQRRGDTDFKAGAIKGAYVTSEAGTSAPPQACLTGAVRGCDCHLRRPCCQQSLRAFTIEPIG